jgi:hypothetical protein
MDLASKYYEKEVMSLLTTQDRIVLMEDDLVSVNKILLLQPDSIKDILYA